MSNDNGQALAKSSPVSHLHQYLKVRQGNLAKYVAGRTKPDTLVSLALLSASQDSWLQKCTAESIYQALITAAQLGLEPGPAKGEAYIVPFKGQATLIPGYRGLIKLALQSKAVKSIYSHAVHVNDEFSVELGSEPRVIHRPAIDGDPGELRGVYAIAQLANGAIDVEWMRIDELEKIRNSAKRGDRESPAYRDWEEQMYRKAAIRRLAKRLPMGEDFWRVNAVDEAAEAGVEPPRFDVSDAQIIDEAKPSSLAGKVAARANAGAIDVEEQS